jgi:hypothetical protein
VIDGIGVLAPPGKSATEALYRVFGAAYERLSIAA